MTSGGTAKTITSNDYMVFGKVEITLKAANGIGVVSSFVMESDDHNEIDFVRILRPLLTATNDNTGMAWRNSTFVESNYFGKGNTSTYNRATYEAVEDPQSIWHSHTNAWTSKYTNWYVDGELVRTLLYDEASNGANSPQTPMQIKFVNTQALLSTWNSHEFLISSLLSRHGDGSRLNNHQFRNCQGSGYGMELQRTLQRGLYHGLVDIQISTMHLSLCNVKSITVENYATSGTTNTYGGEYGLYNSIVFSGGSNNFNKNSTTTATSYSSCSPVGTGNNSAESNSTSTSASSSVNKAALTSGGTVGLVINTYVTMIAGFILSV